MSTLPNPVPLITSTNKFFWDATCEGRLVLQRCTSCKEFIWVPRKHCPLCWKTELEVVDASGKGTVYSFTIVRKGQSEWKDASPFVVAYVELEEGIRVMTNIVDCDVSEVHVGMAVQVVFHDTGGGAALYRFRPA